MTSSARNISLCLWTRTALLKANKLAKEIINFFPCKFFSSCQFAIQTYELSINWVNLCKFVASFPSIFAVSCTPHLLQKFRGKGATYMLVLMFLFFFFSFFDLCITMYLKKFMLSRIPSHNDITRFLAEWLGKISTISLNQISGLLSLNTFQDSCNNKYQSIQTVFHSLKIKLSSACMIQDIQTNN